MGIKTHRGGAATPTINSPHFGTNGGNDDSHGSTTSRGYHMDGGTRTTMLTAIKLLITLATVTSESFKMARRSRKHRSPTRGGTGTRERVCPKTVTPTKLYTWSNDIGSSKSYISGVTTQPTVKSNGSVYHAGTVARRAEQCSRPEGKQRGALGPAAWISHIHAATRDPKGLPHEHPVTTMESHDHTGSSSCMASIHDARSHRA